MYVCMYLQTKNALNKSSFFLLPPHLVSYILVLYVHEYTVHTTLSTYITGYYYLGANLLTYICEKEKKKEKKHEEGGKN